MNTQENNKLIAEFMNLELLPAHDNYPTLYNITKEDNDPQWYALEEFQYDASWDWLMPVVIECFDREEEVSDDLSFKLNDALLETNIESLYKIVVEFINQLNKKVL